ncbi:MAG: cytochrome c [Planctomycetaceae bacterium]|nr:hypothetical protein [Planctomycetota bacterium]NUO14851.1 cytochrome c [Planctomycetaceae bacterium]GIK52858.1 MAG: cytochrome c [Planctomycetota bacterium]
MNYKLTILSAVLGGLALAWAVAGLVGRDDTVRNREIFTEMQYSVAAESQGVNEHLPGGLVEQPPAEGTKYRGQKHYALPAVKWDKLSPEDLARAKNNTGPYAMASQEVRDADAVKGEALFVKACQSCHGAAGALGAPVEKFYPGIANLQTAAAKAYSDGELFHIITHGVRNMPGHASILKTDERWKVILYLRKVQGVKP